MAFLFLEDHVVFVLWVAVSACCIYVLNDIGKW